MDPAVDLVVPIKRLDRAKSRLRGAVPGPHADVVLALLLDTLTAAASAAGVRRVLVVCEDPRAVKAVDEALPGMGVESVDERGLSGLNAALQHGADLLRAGDPHGVVGALQADLPALRPAELASAIAEAGGRRAFCADRPGTGTTLLLSAPGGPLDPRFGPGSAAAHLAGGATPVGDGLATLRCDVDTAADLAVAIGLGLGPHTAKFIDPFVAGRATDR
ncbi:2-phospho-L-lactate guanylyltransferase [Actinophytocola gossypii]|uniref:Phosphoenolpyruvate guanylyltransferase n=1 Tax=Actinophytocola gossypii TaxID=2812003 RepID=A0ABT2JBI3_9PSEU|nr:2-phospho-L-lactate guanylyltransferase [Actinophytocola gossypii]MCT2584800.1 2-phospho-L-lactate guanylyltransferase [Actinophytocola gossypii]